VGRQPWLTERRLHDPKLDCVFGSRSRFGGCLRNTGEHGKRTRGTRGHKGGPSPGDGRFTGRKEVEGRPCCSTFLRWRRGGEDERSYVRFAERQEKDGTGGRGGGAWETGAA